MGRKEELDRQAERIFASRPEQRIADLEAENKRLREALNFYAIGGGEEEMDVGDHARAALRATPEGGIDGA